MRKKYEELNNQHSIAVRLKEHSASHGSRFEYSTTRCMLASKRSEPKEIPLSDRHSLICFLYPDFYMGLLCAKVPPYSILYLTMLFNITISATARGRHNNIPCSIIHIHKYTYLSVDTHASRAIIACARLIYIH